MHLAVSSPNQHKNLLPIQNTDVMHKETQSRCTKEAEATLITLKERLQSVLTLASITLGKTTSLYLTVV